MMFYIAGYELAKALTEDKVIRSMARYEHRKRVIEPQPIAHDQDDAEVVELVFGSHCDEGRIGA